MHGSPVSTSEPASRKYRSARQPSNCKVAAVATVVVEGGTVKLRNREKPRDAALDAGSRTDFGRAVSCQEAKTATDPSRRGERQSTSKYIVNSEAPQ